MPGNPTLHACVWKYAPPPNPDPNTLGHGEAPKHCNGLIDAHTSGSECHDPRDQSPGLDRSPDVQVSTQHHCLLCICADTDHHDGAASVDVGDVPPVIEFSKYRPTLAQGP